MRLKKNGCDRNLQGMNGAILAYGQTASGKTFSISGSTVGHPRLGVEATAYSSRLEAVATKLAEAQNDELNKGPELN